MIVTGPVLFRHTPDPDLKVKVTDLDVKVFKSSYFLNHTMDFLHILFDARYRLKVLFSNTRIHAYDLKVKVIDTNFDCKHFKSSYFPNHMMDLVHI